MSSQVEAHTYTTVLTNNKHTYSHSKRMMPHPGLAPETCCSSSEGGKDKLNPQVTVTTYTTQTHLLSG